MAPVCSAIQRAERAAAGRACGCCAAALPSSTALRSPLQQRLRRSPCAASLAGSRRLRRLDALAPPRWRRRSSASACDPAARRDGEAARPIGISQSSSQRVRALRTCAPFLRRLRAGAARTADGPCAGRSRRRARAAGSTAPRSSVPSQRARRRLDGCRSRHGAGGSRCSRCRGRAPAWPSRCSSSTVR